ncbi:MAG: hypothetical protein AB8G17_15925 [Gammaproteobacteria bacterium]
MNDRAAGAGNPRLGRMVSKVTRRLAGFVLLAFTMGLTTCSALDAVKDNARQATIEQEVRS